MKEVKVKPGTLIYDIFAKAWEKYLGNYEPVTFVLNGHRVVIFNDKKEA